MKTVEPLPQSFFLPSAAEVAPRLLGHLLLRRTKSGWSGGIIVEVEAYIDNDPACHAFRGKTPRNATMFGPPGFAYVYFTYGCHHCANIVCRSQGVAEAVLIRAIEPTDGVEWMLANRPVDDLRTLANGPGKLTAALAIDRSHDGEAAFEQTSAIVVARNRGYRKTRRVGGPVVSTPRIGITQAADWRLRFILSASNHLSRPFRTSVRR